MLYDKVIITVEGFRNGHEGYIDEIYPAGMYDDEEVYMIRFDETHKGMYKENQFKKVS